MARIVFFYSLPLVRLIANFNSFCTQDKTRNFRHDRHAFRFFFFFTKSPIRMETSRKIYDNKYYFQLPVPLMRRSANLSVVFSKNKRQLLNLLLDSCYQPARAQWGSNYILNTLSRTLLEQLTTVNVKHALGGSLDNEESRSNSAPYLMILFGDLLSRV